MMFTVKNMEPRKKTNTNKKIKTNTEEKKAMKDESFAYQINKIREDNNLTQKEFADLLGVSDRTISKWENGLSVPDGISIRKICNQLGISANALVLEKKTLLDYIRYSLKCIGKFLKFLWHNILVIIFIIVFLLLLLFFINNYNAVNIYTLNYNSGDNISIERGYFIKSKVRSFLLIDNISINKIDYDIKSIDVELYTLVIGEKVIIYESDNLDDIVIEELSDYPSVLKSDIINSMKKNLHLNINIIDTNNENHLYKTNIVLKEYFSNDKLIYPTYQSELNYDSLPTYSDNKIITDLNYNNEPLSNDIDTINFESDTNDKLESIGYTYNKETNTYTKTDGIKKIEYNLDNQTILVEYYKNQYKYLTYYYIEKDRIDFNLKQNTETIAYLKYYRSLNTSTCIIGNCENYTSEIDYILKEYQEILATLQT